MTPADDTRHSHSQPICALGVRDESLSALRDETLSAEEATRLRAHIAACVACQGRIAQFEATANALYGQRELEPGDRILVGVRARAEQLAMQPQPRHWFAPNREKSQDTLSRRSGVPGSPSQGTTQPVQMISPQRTRRVWGSLGAVAAVAAIILLFVAIFHGLGGRVPGKNTATSGNTVTANGFPTKPPLDTPTPGTPPPTATLSPTVDAQTAWGTSAIVARVDTRIDSTHVFEASNITYDELGLLGYEVTLTGAGGVDTSTPLQAGILAIATRQFTPIGLSAPTNDPAQCCQDDGRFLVASDNSQPGATCGVCHTRLWVYDRQTGKMRQVASGSDFGGGGILGEYLDHGLLVISYTGQVIVANLAAQTIGPLPGTSSGNYYTLLAYAWPDVVYVQQQKTQDAPFSAHVQNMATGQDTESPALTHLYTISQSTPTNPSESFDSLVISGMTAYCTTVHTQGGLSTLYEIDQFTQVSAQPRTLASVAASALLAANDRLVAFPDGVWDLAQHRFVSGPVINTGAGPYAGGAPPLSLNGHYLAYISPTGTIPSNDALNYYEQVTIYDTSRLPV